MATSPINTNQTNETNQINQTDHSQKVIFTTNFPCFTKISGDQPHGCSESSHKRIGIERESGIVGIISLHSCQRPPLYKDLASKSRKRQLSQARGVVCYLAVDELGYSGDDVARMLRISGRGVSDFRERGKKILDKPEIIREYLA